MIRACILAIVAIGSPLAAQWLHYPTPGIPRTPDGKPDLTAPAPRMANGKPDFSGLWERKSDKYYNNVAADLKPGDVQPWADRLYQDRKKDFGRDSMETLCLPMGPAAGVTPYRDSRIIQSPGMLAILSNDLTYRQIFMDGRELEKDPNPTWMGYSVGHWEGDTLVVESNGFNEKTWLDDDGHPHTENLHLTERYRRPDFGHIDLDVTLDDPKAYAKPWTVAIKMYLRTDTEMIEFYCENEKDRAHMPSNAERVDRKVTAETLAAYVGWYEMKEGGKPVTVEFTADDGVLYWNYEGTGKQRLDSLSDTNFSLAGTQVIFERGGAGPVQRFVMRTVEGDEAGVRKK
jgi:hypothetical protein